MLVPEAPLPEKSEQILTLRDPKVFGPPSDLHNKSRVYSFTVFEGQGGDEPHLRLAV